MIYAVALVTLIVQICGAHPLSHPKTTLDDIYGTPKESLTLLLMGDPQYHYRCEPKNLPCKATSRKCRMNYGLDFNLRAPRDRNESTRAGQLECIKYESRHANKLQRRALDDLITKMRYEPSALIIDGDLTDFGHLVQFEEFKRGWIKDFPIPILAGLGNHDYQNNIDDCVFNFCAHTMLTWLTNFAGDMGVELDYVRDVKSAFDITYNGSFAYATRVCSVTGENCAHVIQLNNAIDYETKFSSIFVDWRIYSPMQFLKRELRKLRDVDIPVLINMHQCEGTRMEKMKEIIGDWIYETRQFGHSKRVAVFYAHMHSKHEVKTFCFHDTSVPFVYVGSVPNNRYTMLRIERNESSLIGLQSKQSGYWEDRNSTDVLGTVNDIWKPCERSNQTFTQFRTRHIYLDIEDIL